MATRKYYATQRYTLRGTYHTRPYQNKSKEYRSTLMHTEIDLSANNHPFAAITVHTAIVLVVLIRSPDMDVVINTFRSQPMLFPSLLLLLHNNAVVRFPSARALIQWLHRNAHAMAVSLRSCRVDTIHRENSPAHECPHEAFQTRNARCD